MKLQKFLHVGCGEATKLDTTKEFRQVLYLPDGAVKQWKEDRLDIDPDVKPDICCSMLDMSIIKDRTYDAIFSSHNLEHLYYHEVRVALKEFKRVLKPDGYVIILVPNIIPCAKMIADNKLEDFAYKSAVGDPIAPIDMLFGWRPALEKGNEFMAHKTAFSKKSLLNHLEKSGFGSMIGLEHQFDIIMVAFARKTSEEKMSDIFREHFIKAIE